MVDKFTAPKTEMVEETLTVYNLEGEEVSSSSKLVERKLEDSMIDTQELLDCPFCGGKAIIENEGTQADITCEDCYASNNIQISDYFTFKEKHNDPDFKWQDAPVYGYATKGKQRAVEVLTKLWNARTPPEEIESLKKQLAEAREALEFYKNRDNYFTPEREASVIQMDFGMKAQTALSTIRDKE